MFKPQFSVTLSKWKDASTVFSQLLLALTPKSLPLCKLERLERIQKSTA